MDAAVFRIMDANLNRAREGLRVVEEYARFALDDGLVTERLKRLRHDLRAGTERVRRNVGKDLAAFRDTPGDVGTHLTTPAEGVRENAADVARASIKRVQEAFRVLEEYGKTAFPGDSADAGVAAHFERLRYEAYALESRLFPVRDRQMRLRAARLYVLVTESLASADALTACREAVAGGADVIQMREKELEDKAFLARAEAMQEVCREAGALFLVNDRPHIARLADADGIHSGQGDLPVRLSRRILGSDRIVGRSTCAPEYAEAACREGADYIGVGPVYATDTKRHRAAVGLAYVRYAAEHVRMPYFCIGGVNRATVEDVLSAGARAVAVCTGIVAATDIAAEAAWYKERILAASPVEE